MTDLWTPLHLASTNNPLKAAKLLTGQRGASVNMFNDRQETHVSSLRGESPGYISDGSTGRAGTKGEEREKMGPGARFECSPGFGVGLAECAY